MVNENGKWIRVEDSDIAKSLGNDEHVVYTLGTQNRRIVINDILFTDYFEIDEKEELVKQGDSYFDNCISFWFYYYINVLWWLIFNP